MKRKVAKEPPVNLSLNPALRDMMDEMVDEAHFKSRTQFIEHLIRTEYERRHGPGAGKPPTDCDDDMVRQAREAVAAVPKTIKPGKLPPEKRHRHA